MQLAPGVGRAPTSHGSTRERTDTTGHSQADTDPLTINSGQAF